MKTLKTVAIKGYMVEFYHKEGDKKLSFRIQDNEKLTDVLLAHCSEKRVKAESIDFAIRGIREKIEHGILDPAPVQAREPQVASKDKRIRGKRVFRYVPQGVRNRGDTNNAGRERVSCRGGEQEAGETACSEKSLRVFRNMSYLSFCRRALLMQGAHGKRIEEQLLYHK